MSTLCSRECTTLASPELSVQSPTSHFFCKACLKSQCFMSQAPALPNGNDMGMDGSSGHLTQCWRGRHCQRTLQAQLPGRVWGPCDGPAPSSAAQEAGGDVQAGMGREQQSPGEAELPGHATVPALACPRLWREGSGASLARLETRRAQLTWLLSP